jgi:hypothetical protein
MKKLSAFSHQLSDYQFAGFESDTPWKYSQWKEIINELRKNDFC